MERQGFKVNPYNPCVANKMVNGEQMTVTWHVDNLRVSHKDGAEIRKFADYLRATYGKKLVEHYSYTALNKVVKKWSYAHFSDI